jgi:UDP-N-acetylglucosamine transferase subunit ALG13
LQYQNNKIITTQQVKQILKENEVKVNVRMGSGTLKNMIGIFGWNFDQISKEKLNDLFPNIIICGVGQAWVKL